jgi:hypothetical protein
VRQEGGTEGNTEGETKQTFLHVSIDADKVSKCLMTQVLSANSNTTKCHMTQVLSANSNTNYCFINTNSFSQSSVST